MVFLKKSFLDTLMQTFIMLRHLVAEISRFKFDDYRVIHTGASDLKLFWVVYIHYKLWDEINHSFPNFIVEVWVWINKFILQFTGVYNYLSMMGFWYES